MSIPGQRPNVAANFMLLMHQAPGFMPGQLTVVKAVPDFLLLFNQTLLICGGPGGRTENEPCQTYDSQCC